MARTCQVTAQGRSTTSTSSRSKAFSFPALLLLLLLPPPHHPRVFFSAATFVVAASELALGCLFFLFLFFIFSIHSRSRPGSASTTFASAITRLIPADN
jgi:hypothetical protein